MQPLTGNANRTPLSEPQPDSNSRTHTHRNHLITDPVPLKNIDNNGSLRWYGMVMVALSEPLFFRRPLFCT